MENIQIGVDLGGTHIKYAFIKNNEIFYKSIINTPKENIVQVIFNQLLKELEKNKINYDNVESISVTIPGIVTKDGKATAVNIGWNNYLVLDKLKQLFVDKKITILNDAKAAVYGEYVYGLKKEKPNVLMYTLGTGVGSGTIINSSLYLGNNTGMVGEVHGGNFQNKINCNCGLGGCVEGVTSVNKLEQLINQNIDLIKKEIKDKQLLDKASFTINDLKEEIKINKVLIDLFLDYLDPLTEHISSMIHMFDFDIIVIGGGISKLGNTLLDLIKQQLKVKLLKPFYDNLDLRVAKLENDAGIIGVVEYCKVGKN